MAADTTWDADWNEVFKACAFRALFQPSPTLQDLYCRVAGKDHKGEEGRAGEILAQSSVAIHVRTGGSSG